MTTLRVLFTAMPTPSRAERWALFDDAGRIVQHGDGAASSWPSADRREAILAADLVRIVALNLPPMPPTRVASAAAFALEDQLATTAEAPAIAVSAQRADGTVLACIAARSAVAAAAAIKPAFDRIVAEPALAPVRNGWTWFRSGGSGGFVRRADGSAFAVGPQSRDDQLPFELGSAIAQATRAGAAPASIHVAQSLDDAMLTRWTRETGTRFVRATPWQWDAATADMYAAAPDLRVGEFSRAAAPAGRRVASLFRPALAVVVIAIAIHAGATLVEWIVLKYDVWQASRSIATLARQAGLTDAGSVDANARAIARWHADSRHRSGRLAANDAVPLLARASSALSALPAGALKSATYADGAWTIELANVSDAQLAGVDRALADAGVVALQAKTGAGYRLRITLGP